MTSDTLRPMGLNTRSPVDGIVWAFTELLAGAALRVYGVTLLLVCCGQGVIPASCLYHHAGCSYVPQSVMASYPSGTTSQNNFFCLLLLQSYCRNGNITNTFSTLE